MESKKVLIVEDEMIISLLLEKMVRNLGYEAIGKIPSGEEAVTFALEHKPDLILMDIRLDGLISGIEAVNQIHKHMSVPVIYISGSTDALNNGALEETNYVSFLSKPVRFSELSSSLRIAS